MSLKQKELIKLVVNTYFRSHLVVNYLTKLIDNGYENEFVREFDRNLATIQNIISEDTNKKMLEQIQNIIESRKELLKMRKR